MNNERGQRKEKLDPVRVVRLTPPGRGAVAVVLVEGPQATETVASCFAAHSGRPLVTIPLACIVLGRWGGPAGEELIVCRRTPDSVEVHPHGGQAAVESVVESLVQRGAAEFSWQAWTAASNACPLRAAAHAALAEASTQRTASILLDQFHGALRRDLEQAIGFLLVGETPGGVPGTARRHGRDGQPDEAAARQILERLSRHGELGSHLVRPWHVVLAGPPNVGKSSLINALVGYQRSIVYDQPGTTRDVVAVRTAVAGWPIKLSDTAGLRESTDPLEVAGVRLAEGLLAAADAVIFVLDAASPIGELERQIAARVQARRRTLVAINKVDLLDAAQRAAIGRLLPGGVHVTSASTREGLHELLDAVAALLVPHPPAPGEGVPFEPQHAQQIDAAITSLDTGGMASAAAALRSLLEPDTRRDNA